MTEEKVSTEPRGGLRLLQTTGILLAAVLFVIDTFTPIEGAIAVLYVLVMLMVSGTLGQREICNVSAACSFLTIVSFLIAHGFSADLPTALRLGVCLAAINMAGGLLVRNAAQRKELIGANDALFHSEWRFRSIFEQSPFSLWEQDYTELIALLDAVRTQGVTDLAAHARKFPAFYGDLADSIITTRVNKATLDFLGAASDSQVLGPLKPLLPADGSGFFKVIQALFEGKSSFEGRGTILDLDGKIRTILIGLTFPDKASGFRRVVVNIVDITQRELTEELLIAARTEMARASRVAAVGALSASIAHELNQPLAAMLINAQTALRWIRRNPPDLDAASHAAERAVRDGKRASAIVQQTRNMLVKGATGDEPIDLQRLSLEVGELLERELSANQIHLKMEFSGRDSTILANRVDMQQVLVNLITNGMQAMVDTDAVREIDVSIDQPDAESVRLSIRDHGPGISEDDVSKLFNPFFTTKQNGMGMGLAISRSAIEASGGSLTAQNHPAGGAVFKFQLPLYKAGA
jgi:signal transduction histidine kinase